MWIIGVLFLLCVLVYACCRVGGKADEQMERLMRKIERDRKESP